MLAHIAKAALEDTTVICAIEDTNAVRVRPYWATKYVLTMNEGKVTANDHVLETLYCRFETAR